MLPLLQGEIPLFLHADETRQIRSGVQWAVQRGFRTVLAGGRDAARVTQLLATNRIPVAYEHVFTQPVYDTDPYDAQFAVPARLHAAGISVAFTEGTDRFGASNIRNIPYAAAQAVAFGLPRQIAWQGLTLVPARMLGVDDRLGSIEVGKDASLIAVDGDILDIRAKVRRLWIQGRESSLESRHTRLYEKYRNRPKKP
jgi:imidazolonepropionase-like amidohydrolase